jgi:hypothetical protein
VTLRCSNCRSYALEITEQSYSDTSAFEAYECKDCGATGNLTHEDNPPRTTLSGDIERDGSL